MSDDIEEAELAEIEQRATRAFAVAPTPWIAQLETRQPIGGETFIHLGDDPALDQEMYIRLYTGRARSPRLTSASMQLSPSLPTPATFSRG